MERIAVFGDSSWKECMRRTGAGPTTTKWIDTDRCVDGEVLVRSRLVARDFRLKGEGERNDLFAAAPPLEANWMLFQLALVKTTMHPERRYNVAFIDVNKAHLNGRVGGVGSRRVAGGGGGTIS